MAIATRTARALTVPRGVPTLGLVSPVLTFIDRPSDSPFVDRIWRSRSERGGVFVSIAQGHFEIAVTRIETRWKLSQNRSRREMELIAAQLDKSADSTDRALAALTRRHLVE